MHDLLARQIEQCTLPDDELDSEKLIALVSSAYDDDARARDRLERSIRLMSEEMAELNSQLELEARALKQAKEAAEAANKAKSSFMAMMSHELRTPLNALMGSAELLSRTPLNVKQSSYLKMFNQAGRLIIALVNDVLDYAKIEAGQLEIESAPTSLREFASDVEAMWAGPAGQKGISLKVETGDLDCDGVLGDPTRLRQIVLNLVSNAVKFTTEGGVSVTFRSSTADGVCDLEIVVEDTGVGIPADRQDSVFRPFIQADSSITRRFGGTGLGLSIARSIALQMGGSLSLVSQVGKGSTFTFAARLALADLDPAADDADPERRDEAPALRILAVDDNHLNRKILAALLEMWPVQVQWATNGAEALDRLNAEAFDVVLMDAQMPVLDGLTATRMLRAGDSINRAVPVVGLTANVGAEDRAACLEAGMTDFVSKPISAESLLGALVRASDQHQPSPVVALAG